MKFRKVSLHQLKPAAYNPRLELTPGMEEYQRLKRSLDEFGIVQPIVWNEKTGNIVSGHQRFKILSDQGETEFDVIVVSLDTQKEKALNITLNNSWVGGDWDPEKLSLVVTELAELPDFDETLTGFSEEEIRDFLFDPDYQNPETALPENEIEDPEGKRVLFKIPEDHWEKIKPEFDRILADYPEVELHVL